MASRRKGQLKRIDNSTSTYISWGQRAVLINVKILRIELIVNYVHEAQLGHSSVEH